MFTRYYRVTGTIGGDARDELVAVARCLRAQKQPTRRAPRQLGDRRIGVDRCVDLRQHDGERRRDPGGLREGQTTVSKVQTAKQNRHQLQFETVARVEVR